MQDFSKLGADLGLQAQQLKQLVRKELPNKIMAAADNIIEESFQKEQYQGKPGTQKWQQRKRDKEGGKDRKDRRALLVKSGKLRRIQVFKRNMTIVIASPMEYAQIHNEGGAIQLAARSELFQRNRQAKGKGKGRYAKGTKEGRGDAKKASTITMPQRQFMPIPGEPFPALDKVITPFVERRVNDILGGGGLT